MLDHWLDPSSATVNITMSLMSLKLSSLNRQAQLQRRCDISLLHGSSNRPRNGRQWYSAGLGANTSAAVDFSRVQGMWHLFPATIHPRTSRPSRTKSAHFLNSTEFSWAGPASLCCMLGTACWTCCAIDLLYEYIHYIYMVYTWYLRGGCVYIKYHNVSYIYIHIHRWYALDMCLRIHVHMCFLSLACTLPYQDFRKRMWSKIRQSKSLSA